MHTMKKIIYILVFIFTLFFLSNSFAQKKMDSLKSVSSKKRHLDSIRLKSMRSLITDHYLFSKTDSALILANNMLDYTHKNKYIKCEIDAQTIIGQIYFEQNKFDIGVESYNKGLDLAKIRDSTIYSKKLFELGILYYDYEDYVNAFKTLQKSQEVCRIVGDSLNEGWSAGYQGFIYNDLGDLKEAEKYHLEHLRLSTKYGIKRSISGANGNLGSVYNDMGNITKSIKHWSEAIKLSKEIGLEEYASIGTLNLISIYIKEKQFSNAIKYLDEYIEVTKGFEALRYSQNIKIFQCQIEYGLGNYAAALQKCESCLKTLETSKNEYVQKKLYKSLFQINKKINRQATALDYFEKYQILIDDEKEEKARTEIQNIIFNNQLATDSIAQSQEKEILNLAHAEDLRKKNQEKYLFLIIGLLILLVVVAYYQVSRRFAATERKRLKEVNQLKNILFTNITHEFRTPLTVIKGMTDFIKSNLENNQGDDLENSLEMIERNSDGLLHLINEMLDLAKIESGNMELNLVQLDIIPFVKYLTKSFHSLAQEKGISFSVHCDIEHLDMDLDVNKFTAIITNLLSNAIKFTSANGEVLVHIDKIEVRNTNFIEINIKDSGLGISKDEQLRIFDKFYQVDNSSSKLQKGTGIGLALVKDFVELMNGSIDVKSKLGKSSIFSIKIPISNNAVRTDGSELGSASSIFKSESAPILLEEDKAPKEVDKDLPLMLIIEDSIDVAHYIKTCLIGNYQILHAPNGAIGIDMALENIPDIIISDVMMPEKDGFEVCERLKTDELTDHIPIIMLTAKATFEDRLTGLSHGADAYLTKPFEKAELLTRIHQLILLRKKILSKFEKTGIQRLLNKNVKNSESNFWIRLSLLFTRILLNLISALYNYQKNYISANHSYIEN